MDDHSESRNLTQLVIKPTIYCYHKCSYCDLRQDYYRDMIGRGVVAGERNSAAVSPTSSRGHIPLQIARRAIDEAAMLGMKSLQLSGGDPLLYPHLAELIRAGARHPGVFVFMNSVGTGVTLEKARDLMSAGLNAWNFSVDTLDTATYERLRGRRNALATIMEAIETARLAAKDFPDFCINYMTVITRENFRDLPGLLRHCIDTGVASMYLMKVYGDETGEFLLLERDIREFRDLIVPEMLSIFEERDTPDIVRDNAKEVLATFYATDNSDEDYAKGVYWPSLESARKACRVPEYYALVEPDGRVLPCCLVEIAHQGEVGNLNTESLVGLWDGEAYARFRQERIDFCHRCPAPQHKTLGLIPKMCRQFNG